MKKIILMLTVLFGLALNATAENYPYRSDYLWVTVPDHADWLYRIGENARIEVQLYQYGIPCDAEVEFEVGDDMLKSDKTGKVKLKNGRAIVNIGTRSRPGFRDLRLTSIVIT